eukprot:gene2385-2137_t
MDDVLAASGKADLMGCKAALRRHLRSSLAPALVAEVAALVRAGGGGDAAGSLACIQYFLECGACLDARKEEGGKTALMIAAEAGRADAVGVMVEHWGRVDTEGNERHAHITAAVDVSIKDNSGHTAHHYASTRHAAEFTREILARLLPIPPCPKPDATAFLQSLGVPAIYLNPEFDRCYCQRCYTGPATISNEGPTPYVVPEPGWVRFGLHVERRAQELDVFNKWCACFHGVKSAMVLKSILRCGGLMKPGSTLIDGTKLESTKCAGRQDEVVYTSPTIKYAGLKFYAEPSRFVTAAGVEMRGSIAVQCRQNPATFEKQGETMAFKRKMPGHLEKHCPHVDLAEIEWKTEADRAVIPYGLLVRVWQKSKDPEATAYSSPVDGTGNWWVAEERRVGQGGGGAGGGDGGGGGAAAIPVVR